MVNLAWVSFNAGAVPVGLVGKNVLSVAQNAAGDYSVNLNDDLGNAANPTNAVPYGTVEVTAAQRAANTVLHVKVEVVSRRQLRVRVRNTAGALTDPERISVYAVDDAETSVGA